MVSPSSLTPQVQPAKLVTWLRKRICGLCFGKRVGKQVVNSNGNHTEFVSRYERHNFKTLSNKLYLDHFSGIETYYFWAGHRQDQEEVLFEFDIDVLKAQGKGTTQGAWDFAKHIGTLFPGVYFEPSTGGNGVHGIGVLVKGEVGPHLVRVALRRLEQFLREEATRIGADIELVEITGLPPVFHSDRRGDIAAISDGVWAKIPRDLSRAADIMNTRKFTLQELQKLVIGEAPQELPAPVAVEHELDAIVRQHRECEAHKQQRLQSEAHQSEPQKSPAVVALEEVLAGKTVTSPLTEALDEVIEGRVDVPIEEPKTFASPVSSIKSPAAVNDVKESTYGSPRFIDTGHIHLLKGVIEKTGCFTDMKIGRRPVNPEQVAILLVILRYLTRKVYRDGSMPGSRIAAIWTALYTNGSVSYAFNNEILTCVRNRLEDRGLLSDQDWSYTPPLFLNDAEGKTFKIKGKACKWRLSFKLCHAIDSFLADKLALPVDPLNQSKGGSMLHTHFQPRELLLPQGRPANEFVLREEVLEQSDAIEQGLYEWRTG